MSQVTRMYSSGSQNSAFWGSPVLNSCLLETPLTSFLRFMGNSWRTPWTSLADHTLGTTAVQDGHKLPAHFSTAYVMLLETHVVCICKCVGEWVTIFFFQCHYITPYTGTHWWTGLIIMAAWFLMVLIAPLLPFLWNTIRQLNQHNRPVPKECADIW